MFPRLTLSTYKLNLVINWLLLSQIFPSFLNPDNLDPQFLVDRPGRRLSGTVHDFVCLLSLLDGSLFLSNDAVDAFDEIVFHLQGLRLETEWLALLVIHWKEQLEMVLVIKLLNETVFVY